MHPDIAGINALPGIYLRLELLGRYGLPAQVCEEMVGFFAPMAEATGTLWEHDRSGDGASLNHGFASHTVVWLFQHALGVKWGPRGREVEVTVPRNDLEWAEGTVPTPEGPILVAWEGERLYQAEVPAGYDLAVD
jgi:hypothetical protein